ncbi:hypothetical protein AAY473_005033 [Plecturocebus cupreus]
MVLSLSRIEVWEPPPRFQKVYGNAWIPGKSLLQRQCPYGEPLLEQCRMEPPHRVPTGALPSGAVRGRPPSSRPQNGRFTDSLHCVPGKATDTQCYPVKAARREAVPCKTTAVELLNTMGNSPFASASRGWDLLKEQGAVRGKGSVLEMDFHPRHQHRGSPENCPVSRLFTNVNDPLKTSASSLCTCSTPHSRDSK